MFGRSENRTIRARRNDLLRGKRLGASVLGWEFATDGGLILVPSQHDWNDFRDENDLPPTQKRRDEIIKRVYEEVIRQKAAGAKYTIGDVYISIAFS